MSFPRSNLIVVIDGLSPKQLADLGQQIKALPTPPIVTLVSTIPILGKHHAKEKQLQAKQDLATAKEILNFPASSEIVPGSNPASAEKFFKEGTFDAMIKRNSDGQPAISVKNFVVTNIQALTSWMPAIDVSENKSSSQYSYKGIFAKSQSLVNLEKQPIVDEHDVPKLKL